MMFMRLFNKQRSPTMTSWSVMGLGALVTLLGHTLSEHDERLGAGVTGFGLAHILLGALDMFRPTIRER